MINASDFMMFMVFSGLALCVAYFRAQYMEWRRDQATSVKAKVRERLRFMTGKMS